MLSLLAAAVAAGLAVGIGRGGSLRPLGAVSVPGWVPAGFLAAGSARAVLALLPARQREVAGRPVLLVAGLLAAAALLGCTMRSPALRRAAIVALIGGGLNAAVMLLNGGMPVSAHGAHRLGVTVPVDEPGPLGRHVVADGSTPLSLLGDVLPVWLGPQRGLVSAGDVLLLLAAGLAVHDLITRHPPKPPAGSFPTPERRC